MTQQEHASVFNQIGVGTQVEIKITAHAAACEHPHRAGKVFGRVAGVFQRFPHHFQKLAVLRVHDGGFFGGKAKKLGIKGFKAVQHGCGRHIVGVVDQMRRFARRLQFGRG